MTPTGDLVGETLEGRFEVLRLLGRGGMGSVYEARHVRLDGRVAVKVLDPRLAGDEVQRKRFLREAKAAVRIRSENVVKITDFGEDPTTFFVMEYLEGQDLATLVGSGGKLEWPRARAIVLQVARALRAAHHVGIVHRDIKPSNIFVLPHEDGSDFVKVLDFGIAKVEDVNPESLRLTRTNQLVGTILYMPPEQALARGVDVRSDVYSLGIVLFQILTGALPFVGSSPYEVLEQHVRSPPPAPRSLEPSIPARVEAIILRALAKDPRDRFQSMEELAEAIEQISNTGDLMAPAGSFVPHVVGRRPPLVDFLIETVPSGDPTVPALAESTAIGSLPHRSGRMGVLAASVGAGVVVLGLAVGIVIAARPSVASRQPVAALEAPPRVDEHQAGSLVRDLPVVVEQDEVPSIDVRPSEATAPPDLARDATQTPAEPDGPGGAEGPGAVGQGSSIDRGHPGAAPGPEARTPGKADGPPIVSKGDRSEPSSGVVVPGGSKAAETKGATTPEPVRRDDAGRSQNLGKPLSDAAAEQQIRKRARRCGTRGTVTLKFQVLREGTVKLVTTRPVDDCIANQVESMTFAPRDRPTHFEIVLPP